jgi:hypothetical protein
MKIEDILDVVFVGGLMLISVFIALHIGKVVYENKHTIVIDGGHKHE